MSKKKSEKDPTFPYSEFDLEWNKGTEYPDSLFEIEDAIISDLTKILRIFADNSANHFDITWIMGEGIHEFKIGQMGEFLEFILNRNFLRVSLGKNCYTYDYYEGRVLDVAIMKFISSSIRSESIDISTSPIVVEIQNYIISQIFEREALKAQKLLRFASSLKVVQDLHLNESYTVGKSNSMAIPIRQLKLLRALISFLDKGVLPSKKALRHRASSIGDGTLKKSQPERGAVTMREEDLSEAIRNMEIGPLLPDSSRRGKSQGGTTHTLKPIFKGYRCFESNAPNEKKKEDPNNFFSGGCQIQISSREGEKFGHKVARIRNRLGPAYSLFLLQFGMTAISSQQDYEIFESNLSKMGLVLK